MTEDPSILNHTTSASLNLLLARIKRPIPEETRYLDRLEQELEIIDQQNFVPHFLRVLEILELTKDLPHITRGSAGSSLVCYLLGITDVDPVAHNIPLARFLNPLRDLLTKFIQVLTLTSLNKSKQHEDKNVLRLRIC